MVPGLLPIFLHGCEIKSGSGLGTRLKVTPTKTQLRVLSIIDQLHAWAPRRSAYPQLSLPFCHSRDKSYQALSRFSVLEATRKAGRGLGKRLLLDNSSETTIVSSATKYDEHSLPPSDIRSSDKHCRSSSDNILF